MKPVMASLRAKFGERVTYHYHEFNHPESAQVDRDFEIKARPVVIILDQRGRVARRFAGIVSDKELEETLRPLLR